MACDRSFENIERKVTHMGVVYTPKDYVDIISTAVAKGFPVIQMEQSNFFYYVALSKYITQRKPIGTSFRDCRKILIRVGYREGYYIKSDYEFDNNNTAPVCLMKRNQPWSRRLFDLAAQEFPLKYGKPIVLRPEKIADLKSLLVLMPATAHPFYNALFDAQANSAANVPDEGSCNFDKLLDYE